jgi:hypothetical protein
MKLVSIVKLTGVALICTLCSSATGAEDAKRLAPPSRSSIANVDDLTLNGRLKYIVQNFRQYATNDQYRLLTGAILASPALAKELSTLADNGLLTTFSIDTPPSGSARPGTFGAGISGTDWVFKSSFLEEQGTARIYDVVDKDDILPNNMVFALGHLAFHAQREEQFKKDEEALKGTSSDAVASDAKRKDFSNPMERWIDLRLRYEAGAFIHGWNYVYDAAVLENHTNPLSANQVGSLLLNLRNRAIFLKAMNNNRLFSGSGRIEQTATNVDAIVVALHGSKLIDIE